MRVLSPARGAAASAVTIALTIAAFAIGPAATAKPSARAAGLAAAPGSVRPGVPLRMAGLAQARTGASATYSTKNSSTTGEAGYGVLQGSTTFRYLAASFYVPRLDCTDVPSSTTTYSFHWLGLQNESTAAPTEEEVGVEADCNGVTPEYAAWWEMYPNPQQYPGLAIGPGDRVSASVYYDKSTGKFRLTLTDNSTGHGFTRTESCPSGSSCGRPIAEVLSGPAFDPSTGEFLPLADFQAATFANVSVTNTSGTQRGGLSSKHWTDYRITETAGVGETDADGNVIPQGTVLIKPTTLIGSNTFDNYWMPGT